MLELANSKNHRSVNFVFPLKVHVRAFTYIFTYTNTIVIAITENFLNMKFSVKHRKSERVNFVC